MVICVIGAGASGMAAALSAAEYSGAQVILLERQARVGKKLLATGNGRCNLSNRNACKGGYHGQQVEFVKEALAAYGPEETLAWFRKMGLYTVTESSGKVYPYSDQANSVVDVLRFALEKPNIQVRTGFEVKKVRRQEGGFLVESGEEKIACDKFIIACGGLAGTKLGGSMLGYKLLNQLGHKTTRLRPALVQLKCQWSGVTALKGVRSNCHIQVLKDGVQFSESKGELHFTDYGLSGPVVFEVSRDACSDASHWTACIDFLPEISEDDLFEELCRRTSTLLPAEELLTGILHNRLGRVLAKVAGIKDCKYVSQMTMQQIRSVSDTVKRLEIILTEPMGMENAQVTAGGVITADFDSATMESKLVPGLYACGEVLDIDGDCGGYNLQWAWSSGRLAGRSAGKEIE